jgi:monoamine oxidase
VRVIVLGSEPNGLVAARSLKQSGHDVVVLEPRDEVGGLAGAATVAEGVSHVGVLHDSHLV